MWEGFEQRNSGFQSEKERRRRRGVEGGGGGGRRGGEVEGRVEEFSRGRLAVHHSCKDL